MKPLCLAWSVALAVLCAAAPPAGAQSAAPDVPASVRQFYDALTAAPGKDVAGLVTAATTPDWVSCGNDRACGNRAQVIAGITARQKAIPDLRWEITEIVRAGDRIIVRGEASGTPAADFQGLPHSDRPFRIMSIDVHTLAAGKLARSYHVEDWMGAARQVQAP